MNRKGRPRNVAASVRARLTQRARDRQENVQLALIRYAIERLLYRLGLSSHREEFVLKGAMLFSLWAPTPYRSTGDLDLLGFGDPTPERIVSVFRDICLLAAADDGVAFKPETIQAHVARLEEEYSGIRLTLDADIAGARLPLQIDIGFGDIVTPGVQDIDYPSLLDMPLPHLRAYPPETVVAEKLQALVALGLLNSRMKDFFDLWAISETFAFAGSTLAHAIQATFERRATAIPLQAPIALTEIFSSDPTKQAQWRGFLRRTAIALAPAPLPDLLHRISDFVMPPLGALHEHATFTKNWTPGGPWQ
ncbi:MAG: hypothetical protein FD144_5849 [Rhodospirillaceae bacterium]|nr:MAG: hypothetical protein FD144_5849 [Rhodospirillaceae bacterium]